MTAAQTALIERIRELLTNEPFVREVSMFGGRSFMVNEKMIVSALKHGGLLVRVPADQHDELLNQSGAIQAEMGVGRTMGPGWIEVSSESISGDDGLSFWIGIALAFNQVVTGGRG